MKRFQFPCQNTLVKPAVTRPQDRSTVTGKFQRSAQPRGQHGPRVQRAQALHDRARFAALSVQNREILAHRFAAIDAQSRADGQRIRHSDRVTGE